MIHPTWEKPFCNTLYGELQASSALADEEEQRPLALQRPIQFRFSMQKLVAGKKKAGFRTLPTFIRPLARPLFITGLNTWGILGALSAMCLLLPSK